MSYLEELLPEFRKGAKIRRKCWDKERFLVYSEGVIRNDHNCPIFEVLADWSDTLLESDWELYKPDWDYIIKNKCLCWFWDYEDENKKMGILADNDKDGTYLRDGDCYYNNCRPVHRDEVTFYEDRKE